MLKWAMRIVAVGGALLAMAVGTAAWMHRIQTPRWLVATPAICSFIYIYPHHVQIEGWLRSEADPKQGGWKIGLFGIDSDSLARLNSGVEDGFRLDFGNKIWGGFGVGRADSRFGIPSWGAVLIPMWAVIAVLLLPMGLLAGIGWRQRRRVKAGHCPNCEYDLRATPEKCPECGRATNVKLKSA